MSIFRWFFNRSNTLQKTSKTISFQNYQSKIFKNLIALQRKNTKMIYPVLKRRWALENQTWETIISKNEYLLLFNSGHHSVGFVINHEPIWINSCSISSSQIYHSWPFSPQTCPTSIRINEKRLCRLERYSCVWYAEELIRPNLSIRFSLIRSTVASYVNMMWWYQW